MQNPMIVLADLYVDAVGHLEVAEMACRQAKTPDERQAAQIGVQIALEQAIACHRDYWKAVALRMQQDAAAADVLVHRYKLAAHAGGLTETLDVSPDLRNFGDIPIEAPDSLFTGCDDDHDAH